ncbi:MAG: hypothetical protein KAV82_07755 [Phycisphaerae bacterium]|nr:hypothetical protein [Phycisphaerae bacterium]
MRTMTATCTHQKGLKAELEDLQDELDIVGSHLARGGLAFACGEVKQLAKQYIAFGWTMNPGHREYEELPTEHDVDEDSPVPEPSHEYHTNVTVSSPLFDLVLAEGTRPGLAQGGAGGAFLHASRARQPSYTGFPGPPGRCTGCRVLTAARQRAHRFRLIRALPSSLEVSPFFSPLSTLAEWPILLHDVQRQDGSRGDPFGSHVGV